MVGFSLRVGERSYLHTLHQDVQTDFLPFRLVLCPQPQGNSGEKISDKESREKKKLTQHTEKNAEKLSFFFKYVLCAIA